MPTADEASRSGRNPLAGDLAAGIDAISQQQVVVFTKYVRLVLPLDGYVFWVKADIVSQSAILNASAFNKWTMDESPMVITPAASKAVKGSLHFSSDTRQEETESYVVNRVIFSAEDEVQDLNEIGPNVIFIATFEGVRFAFSQRGSFYRQAKVFHYVGNAIYSDMETQIVDSPIGFDSGNVIVSDSLPLWLAFNGYVPKTPAYGFSNTGIPLYPSFLVPTNLAPPFASVHIVPESTRSLTGAPVLGRRSSHTQLCAETVRITIFGTRNFNAMDFVDCVMQRCLDFEEFGIMNMPALRDEKRTQTELGAIAQKKSIVFDINYYQEAARNVARQLVEQALVTYTSGEQAV